MKTDAIIHALAGVYNLVNMTTQIDGAPAPELAAGKWTGQLIYTKSAYMSVVFTTYAMEDLPNNGEGLSWPPSDDPALNPGWAIVAKNVLAYGGPFSIDPAYPASRTSGGVIHGPLHVKSAPMLSATDQRRNYTVVRGSGKDAQTYLSLIVRNDTLGRQATLLWVKVSD
ncbi:hypothetical protein QBC42DRAFT_276466 [Cladorrhinum samala]|uniref:Lipocalin-like domain-containing protein n=1 Tax=Cladorrhinum samala TaxID=585594 RepID=A0AAV9HDE6_9PEZI|nr:hypothetical protein QBC42DRAFT_276466 [Cladorrhinum samala]